jgi:predicted MPP superfamily phosphohydrolase
MKTVSIGDTHGIAVAGHVRKIVDDHDKFIFIGDYVDSYDIDNISMKKNLLDLVELKGRYPEKIVLLWGNHDIQYLLGREHLCTGFRPEMEGEFHRIFSENENLFQLSYQVGDHLWTHAGINEIWYEKRFREGKKDEGAFADVLNEAFALRYPPVFDVGCSRGGRYQTGGPLWCDKDELKEGPHRGYIQIAGHNMVKEFETIFTNDSEVVFIDKLGNEATVSASSFYYREIQI